MVEKLFIYIEKSAIICYNKSKKGGATMKEKLLDDRFNKNHMIKRFMIFGDSYSTHKDYIPKEYAYYYCDEGRSPEQPVTKMRMQETWWGQMIERTNAQLLLTDSWSGSTIGYTGYEGDCSTSSSFIYRYRKLMEQNFFAENCIDTIIVFGGTNDSWTNAPLGEMKYSDFCEDDFYNVLPAICYFMTMLKKNHPDTNLILIGNCEIKDEILDCMIEAAERMNMTFVSLHDIDKVQDHPTVLGMTQICDQVIEKLKSCNFDL